VQRLQPDLALLDISMPRMSGLEALRDLRPNLGRTRVVMLSAAIEQSALLTSIRLGARAVVQKDSATEVLFDAMVRVLAGQSWIGPGLVSELVDMVRVLAEREQGTRGRPFGLTPREREVLALVVEGCPNKEIASRCAVSEETIKHHLTRMFDKVGASNRLELAMTARSSGLVD
jgi:DNA-binding NarL/FixJ family response regulator